MATPQVRFHGWEDHRQVRLIFLEEEEEPEFSILNIEGAEVVDTTSESGESEVVLRLGRLSSVHSMKVSFQMGPAPHGAPRIVCHPVWSPPPPKPSPRPPSPPPSASPRPPPPPDAVQGLGACPVRAEARVEHFKSEGAHDILRVAVTPGLGRSWDAEYEVTIGVRGQQLEATHMVCPCMFLRFPVPRHETDRGPANAQTHAVLRESMQEFADYAEFVFTPDPSAASFEFNVDGRGDEGRVKLSEMNCRRVGLPPMHALVLRDQTSGARLTHPQGAWRSFASTAAVAAADAVITRRWLVRGLLHV